MRQCRSEIAGPECPLCVGDYPAEFVDAITSTSGTIGNQMSPDSFRRWLMDEAREPDL